MTGFTFPGIIVEPLCTFGKIISPIPQSGPEDKNLRSFDIFIRLSAKLFIKPKTEAKAAEMINALMIQDKAFPRMYDPNLYTGRT